MNPLGRLLRSWAWKFFPRADARVMLSTGLVVPVRSKGDLCIVTEIFIERDYAPFLERIGDLRRVLDLGCNTGFFTLFLHDWLRRAGRPDPERVILVDADPDLVARTQQTLAANGLIACHTHHGLIGPRNGHVDFFVQAHAEASSVFVKRGHRLRLASLDLAAFLDAELPGRFDLLKADIEGGEEYLLNDWLEVVNRARWLIVEWHHFQTRWADARARLESAGWAVRLERESPVGFQHALLENVRDRSASVLPASND